MAELAEVLAALDLERVDDAPGHFRGDNLDTPGPVVFGGQILAQMIVAADRTLPDKSVRSVHTVFSRGATLEAPVEYTVEVTANGRSVGSMTVTASQGDRVCARTLVLASAEEPDFIRHGPPSPSFGRPEAAAPSSGHDDWWETRIVGNIDIATPSAIGPAELQVWSRVPGAPDPDAGQAINQALLAYATDGWLIATAMRPHDGVGQALAHRTIATTVLAHTLVFHEPVRAGEWALLVQESPYAGRGRSFGRAQVFDSDGELIASFSQENMIRAAAAR